MARLLDGSMWKQLEKFGFDVNNEKNKPHWSFLANDDHDLMEKVYTSFLDIGVNVITTNTYHFGSTLDETITENADKKHVYEQYFEKTCEILQNVSKKYNEVQVWGSVGTLATLYHDCSEYTGAYIDLKGAEITAHRYFKDILTLFQTRTTIRHLIFETVSSELEGYAALKALKEFPEMRAVISFTFKENACLRHGDAIHNIAEEIKRCPQTIGVGINCTDPENVMPVLSELRKYKFPEIFVYPNIGDSKFLKKETDDTNVFNQGLVSSWVENGATAIGGCCGTTEVHMKLLKKLLDKNKFS